ncbi:hypothetical protein [Spirosoma validum]|uniref:Uncharacterized protein n=1 Tax=Spirosoma validum TaxID=2771355 RepID=A0A927B1Y7_9BACT|nr:hypothetical protein [Spirosoma validum]MBD2754084.1 hypothetical protein [Spirosoma validum]
MNKKNTPWTDESAYELDWTHADDELLKTNGDSGAPSPNDLTRWLSSVQIRHK